MTSTPLYYLRPLHGGQEWEASGDGSSLHSVPAPGDVLARLLAGEPSEDPMADVLVLTAEAACVITALWATSEGWPETQRAPIRQACRELRAYVEDLRALKDFVPTDARALARRLAPLRNRLPQPPRPDFTRL
ncbi:hypothetical protein [Streptomyces smyrnaeus]|uniref:Uncharacterized protein n=1 Tax=Streptomyces smyrnaeus TaxID=1387713 RepID=A0ABS3Y687_9ACTN|nr:hypothetical protein [Streptomyces smyrnaeus]MBO8203179.1 hypothetical protein [Streptomyces smyrnaeus]